MKKRIVLFLLAIFAVFGVTACGADPYSKMNLTVDTTSVNLSLIEVDKEIVSDGVGVVNVAVSAPKGISSDIVLPQYGNGVVDVYGNEYVEITKKTTDVGQYQLEFTAKKQGYTEIQIRTQEGYLSQTIAINIDVALKEISFKENANVVVELGASYNLKTYAKSLIDFKPSYTTQTNVEFSISDFGSNSDDQVYIQNGILYVASDATPSDDLKIIATSQDNADCITMNALTISIIRPLDLTYDKQGTKSLLTQLVDSQNNAITINQVPEGSTASNVYYELIFANPDVDSIDENMDLKCIFGGQLSFEINRVDYKIVYDGEDSDCVSILNGNSSKEIRTYKKSFVLEAKDSGEYVAVFKVEYVGTTDNGQYDGLYTKYINVKIKVVSLPTSKTILINDKNYIEGENSVAVYDSYISGDGSRLNITSTNNPGMTFKYANNPNIEVVCNNNIVTSGVTFISGSTLYLKNISGQISSQTFVVTLTVDVSNEYYNNHETNKQTYSMPIKITLNLITGLSDLVINDLDETHNSALDIIENKNGKVLHEFAEGISAENVVASIRYGNSTLFSYKFEDNKIIVYPTPYKPGDEIINEGSTTLVVYLTNGVRSYNQDGNDTKIMVKATYEMDGEKTRIITNLDDKNEGFFAYLDEDFDFNNQNNIEGRFQATQSQIQYYKNVEYNNFEKVVLSTNSAIDLDLYKLFIYQSDQGKNQIGYVNRNSLKVVSSDNSLVQWYDGKLYTYSNTTYNEEQDQHQPVTLYIYDSDYTGEDNGKYNTDKALDVIDIYVVRRIAKVALEQQHFDLYDGTSDNSGYQSLNQVYEYQSTAKLVLKVWTINADGTYEVLTGDEINEKEFGNFWQFYTLIGAEDTILENPLILRKNLIELNLEESKITASLSNVVGVDLKEVLGKIYTDKQSFSYNGRVRQYNSEFVAEFTVSVDLAVKSSNIIIPNIDNEMGLYFEHDDQSPLKEYTFNYTIFPSTTTFRDVFVQVFDQYENIQKIAICNGDYRIDENGNKVPVYRKYENGFESGEYRIEVININGKDVEIKIPVYRKYEDGFEDIFDTTIYTPDGFIIEDISKLDKDYFIIYVSNSTIKLFTNQSIPGTYIIKVNTVDSYNDGIFSTSNELCFFIADGSLNAPYQIRSSKDFEYFLRIRNKNLNGKYFVLATDVYLSKPFNDAIYENGKSYYQTYLDAPLKNNLSGKFDPKQDGNYYMHTIYGVNISLNNVESDMNIGLFTNIANGIVISHVTLDNLSISITTTTENVNLNIGGLVGALDNNAHIIACKVNGNIVVKVNDNQVSGSAKEINIGGIVGSYTTGTIMSIPDEKVSVNNSDINSTINIEYVSNKSANLGGVAGKMENTELVDVRAIANIVALNLERSDYVDSNIGGVVGSAKSSIINNVISYPSVVGKSNVGGILGRSVVYNSIGTTIKNSQVQLLYNINMKNVVAGLDKIGGIIGFADLNTTLNYVYVRSYSTKEFNPYYSDRANVNFYQDYSLKYYGSVVLLNSGNSGAAAGGLIGAGWVDVNNSNFTSNLVSFNPNANFGGVVGTRENKLKVTTSYVDGKIVYYVDSSKKFYNSFNIIMNPGPDSRMLEVKQSTPDVTYNYDGELTTDKNSFITITRTKTYNNAVVEYTDTLPGSDNTISEFYAKINNSIFGIMSADYASSVSYRGYSDKVERLTIIIYNTGSGIRMYARNEVYENTPSGMVYSNYIIGSKNGTTLEIWGSADAKEMQSMDIALAQQLIALGIHDGTKRYYITGSEMDSNEVYNIENLPTTENISNLETLLILVNKLEGFDIGGEDYNNITTDEDKLIYILDKVAEKCEQSISSSSDVNDNISTFKIVKTKNIDIAEVSLGYESGTQINIIDSANITPKITTTINGIGYVFEYQSGQENFIITTQGVKENVVLLTEGVQIIRNKIEETSDFIYYSLTNNASEITHILDLKTNLLYRVSKVEIEENNEVKYEYNGNTYYATSQLAYIISANEDKTIKCFGESKVVYLDSTFTINEDGTIINNQGELQYRIVGENIYDAQDQKIESNFENYYAVSYSLSLSAGDISISNTNIPGLYDELSLKSLFEAYKFNFTNGEILGSYDNNDYYMYGNSWYFDSSFNEEIIAEDIDSDTLNLMVQEVVNSYDKETIIDLLEEYGKEYEESNSKEELLLLLPEEVYNKIGLRIQLENEKNKLILEQLKDSKGNTNYNDVKIAYYDSGSNKWYSDTLFRDEIVEEAVLNQLRGKYQDSLYYDIKTLTYKTDKKFFFYDDVNDKFVEVADTDLISLIIQYELQNAKFETDITFTCTDINPSEDVELSWTYFINNATYPVVDNNILIYLKDLSQDGKSLSIPIFYSNWKDGDNYVTNKDILGELAGKAHNSYYYLTQTAYYRDNWYYDFDYTQQVTDNTILEGIVKKDQTAISTNIESFNIVINGLDNTIQQAGAFTIADAIESIAGSFSNTKILIKDNVLYVAKTKANIDSKDIVLDTIEINNTIHYVIGKALITGSSPMTWLMSHKINDNLPVELQYNYNKDVQGDEIANYKLFYDELATLTLTANGFSMTEDLITNPNNDYIYIENGTPEHGHLKLDNNTIVLMYNKPISQGVENTENTYELAFGEQDGHFVATLNGIVVDLSSVEIDIENALQLIVTSSNSGVVAIERQDTTNNFDVVVKGEGSAEINFHNLKDDSIKVTLNVYTIKGFTNFNINNANGEVLSSSDNVEVIVGGDSSDYTFNFVNQLKGINYEANNGGFKLRLLSIDKKSELGMFEDGINYSSIMVNNITIDKSAFLNNKLEFTFNTPNLSFLGINQNNDPAETNGQMEFEVVPYIICNGQQIYIDELAKKFTVEISNPAQLISFSETHNVQIPTDEKPVTVSIYSNYQYETLILQVSGNDFDTEYYEFYNDYRTITKQNSLLKFRLQSANSEPVQVNGVEMWLHTYTILFSMNAEEYRIQTSNDGINAIAVPKNYTFVAYPKTHFVYENFYIIDEDGDELVDADGNPITIAVPKGPKTGAISATYDLTIAPVTATSIETNFYPYLKSLDQNNVETTNVNDITGYALEQIYDIRSLPPDSYGLLKIEINPKYNNTLVMQLEFDKQYVGYISFQQIMSVPYKTGEGFEYGYYSKLAEHLTNSDINITNTTVLWDVPYPTDKAWNSDTSQYEYPGEWIYSEYYVAVYLSKDCPQGITIPITIKAFDDSRNQILTDVVSINVEPIPFVTLTIDNSKNVIRGVNEYVPIQITAQNIDNKAGALTLETDELDLYTFDGENYIKCEDFKESIDPTIQYYISTTKAGNNYAGGIGTHTLTLSTTRDINGREVGSQDSATIEVVWLTVESVSEVDIVQGTITLKTGMYKGFSVNVTTNAGFKNLPDDVLINGKTPKEYLDELEKEIAGRAMFDTSYWYYNNDGSYTHLSVDDGGQLFSNFVFSRYQSEADEDFFRISAIQEGNLDMRLSFHYRYNNGWIETNLSAINGSDVYNFAYDYNFNIVIGENSSQDNPIPIYDAEDLMSMQKDVNYILQSDITLDNWKPMAFNSAYLDGNGFSITINSFDMSDLKGRGEVYAGLFSTIAEGCIVKNLNINIGNLLYSDTALNSVKNGETNPNIDLRETPIVYFGVLAGQNDGIIINVKVINMNSRRDGNTLYVGITREYFSQNGENILSQGYVGGLVAVNAGSITNSFVGLNADEKIEKSVVVGAGNSLSSVYSYIYSFNLEACNNVGGMVYSNNGTITNSYIKSINIKNNARISDNSTTAGFVSQNTGSIYSCAVSTNVIQNFKSYDTQIKSASITSGFVNTNDGTVEDCYTNIQINNQNVETAGFVYDNDGGTIKNCYTTSKNTSIVPGSGNTSSHGLFVYNKANYGIIENSYYLVFGAELGAEIDDAEEDAEVLRSLDPAIAIIKKSGEEVTEGEFNGFNFAVSKTSCDGIWYIAENSERFPELAYAENINYYSLRSLINIDKTNFELTYNDSTKNVSAVIKNSTETLERYDTLTSKTSVWYFYDDNNMFEVLGSNITEIISSSPMSISMGSDNTSDIKTYYFKFVYNETTYQVYYNDNTGGFRVVIGGITKRFANYSFTYLGYEFIVIREGNNFKMVTNNGYQMVNVAKTSVDGYIFEYGGNSNYTYLYVKNNLGTKYNPIVVTNSEEFAKYIVNNTNEYVLQDGSRKYIFGLVENTGDGAYARYVHIANNINFRNEDEETDKNIAASYEVNNSTKKITINDVIFNGVLIGNSMSINNIILNSTQSVENYGIFSEVGVNDALRYELGVVGITNIPNAQVFNLKLKYQELSNTSANKVGLLAGTISNAIVNKVDIEGVNQVNDESRIIGQNLVGALAGLIYGSDDSTNISEITVKNVNVLSIVNQLSNLNESTIATNQSYTSFSDKSSADSSQLNPISFESYKDLSTEKNTHDNIKIVANLKNPRLAPSYAGAVAGAIVMDTEISENDLKALDNYSSYKDLREYTKFPISDMLVSGTINIQADMSGGIAGYMGTQETGSGLFAYNLQVELNEASQQNIYGYVYAGGIVGQSENAYFMETKVGHSQDVQDEIDKKINSISSTDVSSSYLFSKENDNTKYNVAIGGIVGRMHNTWIVDSYSKANVENKNSFIAGGVAGYVTGNSYFAYTYTIGNVLAKNMIGGFIGYYYQDENQTYYNLNLYNAFAVNVWNSSIKDLLKVNEKAYKYEIGGDSNKEITKLTDKEILAYEEIIVNDDATLTEEQQNIVNGYRTKVANLYLNTMPELGNQQLSATINVGNIEGVKPRVDNSYLGFASYERFTYIGSVLGRYSEHDASKQELFEDVVFYNGVEYDTIVEDDLIVKGSEVEVIDGDYKGLIGTVETIDQANNKCNIIVKMSDLDVLFENISLNYVKKIKTFNEPNSLNKLNELVGVRNDVVKTSTEDENSSEEYYTYYNDKNFNVISSTYGRVKHDGSISEGDFESIILNDKINLSYFKSIYKMTEETSEGYNSYNINTYSPVFGKQYYISYITGDFINNSTEEKVGNKYYKNEFTSSYGFVYKNEILQNTNWVTGQTGELYINTGNLDELKKMQEQERAKQENTDEENKLSISLDREILGAGLTASNIWYVDNGYSLPKYGHNSNETFGLVNDETSLKEALTSGAPGMFYRIDKNNTHDGNNCGGEEDKTLYHISLPEYELNLNNSFFLATEPITIVIKPNTTTGVTNIFNVITGCTFMNITFEIDLSGISSVRTYNSDGYFGFFANVVNASLFTNCKFICIFNGGTINIPTASNGYNIESMGLVVGFANNTAFSNCETGIVNGITFKNGSSEDESQHQSTLINFGGFAGNTWLSTLKTMKFTASDLNIVLDAYDDAIDHSFAGFIGKAQSTGIENIIYSNQFTFTGTNLKDKNYNIGRFIGHALNDTSITGVTDNSDTDTTFTFSGNYATANTGFIGFVDGITGMSNVAIKQIPSVESTNVNINYGTVGKVQARSSGFTMSEIEVNETQMTANITLNESLNEPVTINVGSIIGFKSNNVTTNLQKCINYANIKVDSSAKDGTLINVGGFVGNAFGLRIIQSVNLGNMEIVNQHEAEIVKFGGFLGSNTTGTVTIENSINYGDQKFSLTDNANFKVGGFVGDMGNKNINLTYALALGNIINESLDDSEFTGVVSKNSINGVANNYKHLAGNHAHYVAEHDARHAYNTSLGTELIYRVDDLTVSYAWQYVDFYTHAAGKLYSDDKDKCLITWETTNSLPVVSELSYSLPATEGSKFNPLSDIPTSEGQYAILDGILEGNVGEEISGKIAIPNGSIITYTDKKGLDINIDDYNYIATNYGTISNIKFKIVADKSNGRSIGTNYGNLMNVGFYDDGDLVVGWGDIAPVLKNYGGIYASGSMLQFRNLDADKNCAEIEGTVEVSFIANTNAITGEIAEVYTTSTLTAQTGVGVRQNGDGSSIRSDEITFGAIAHYNYGTITNTYAAVSVMILDETGNNDPNKLLVSSDNKAYSLVYNMQYNEADSKWINIDGAKNPTNSYSCKTIKNGNLKPSDVKSLADDGGALSQYIWQRSNSSANNGYPYIKSGVELIMSFLDGEVITSIERLNDWINWTDEHKSGNNDFSITIDITEIIGDDTVVGSIKTNTGSIIIKNLTTSSGTIKFKDTFVNTNHGEITSENGKVSKVLLSSESNSYFVGTNGCYAGEGDNSKVVLNLSNFNNVTFDEYYSVVLKNYSPNLTIDFTNVKLNDNFVIGDNFVENLDTGDNLDKVTITLSNITLQNYLVYSNGSYGKIDLSMTSVTLDTYLMSSNAGTVNFNKLSNVRGNIEINGTNEGSLNFVPSESIKNNITIGSNSGTILFNPTGSISGNITIGENKSGAGIYFGALNDNKLEKISSSEITIKGDDKKGIRGTIYFGCTVSKGTIYLEGDNCGHIQFKECDEGETVLNSSTLEIQGDNLGYITGSYNKTKFKNAEININKGNTGTIQDLVFSGNNASAINIGTYNNGTIQNIDVAKLSIGTENKDTITAVNISDFELQTNSGTIEYSTFTDGELQINTNSGTIKDSTFTDGELQIDENSGTMSGLDLTNCSLTVKSNLSTIKGCKFNESELCIENNTYISSHVESLTFEGEGSECIINKNGSEGNKNGSEGNEESYIKDITSNGGKVMIFENYGVISDITLNGYDEVSYTSEEGLVYKTYDSSSISNLDISNIKLNGPLLGAGDGYLRGSLNGTINLTSIEMSTSDRLNAQGLLFGGTTSTQIFDQTNDDIITIKGCQLSCYSIGGTERFVGLVGGLVSNNGVMAPNKISVSDSELNVNSTLVNISTGGVLGGLMGTLKGVVVQKSQIAGPSSNGCGLGGVVGKIYKLSIDGKSYTGKLSITNSKYETETIAPEIKVIGTNSENIGGIVGYNSASIDSGETTSTPTLKSKANIIINGSSAKNIGGVIGNHSGSVSNYILSYSGTIDTNGNIKFAKDPEFITYNYQPLLQSQLWVKHESPNWPTEYYPSLAYLLGFVNENNKAGTEGDPDALRMWNNKTEYASYSTYKEVWAYYASCPYRYDVGVGMIVGYSSSTKTINSSYDSATITGLDKCSTKIPIFEVELRVTDSLNNSKNPGIAIQARIYYANFDQSINSESEKGLSNNAMYYFSAADGSGWNMDMGFKSQEACHHKVEEGSLNIIISSETNLTDTLFACKFYQDKGVYVSSDYTWPNNNISDDLDGILHRTFSDSVSSDWWYQCMKDKQDDWLDNLFGGDKGNNMELFNMQTIGTTHFGHYVNEEFQKSAT